MNVRESSTSCLKKENKTSWSFKINQLIYTCIYILLHIYAYTEIFKVLNSYINVSVSTSPE